MLVRRCSLVTAELRFALGHPSFFLLFQAWSLRLSHQNPLRQKFPPGAEAGAVLAGQLGFLEQPLGVFVRLRDPVVLGPLIEVPLPSRSFTEMKLPGQEESDVSSASKNVPTGELDSGPGSGVSPDGPLGTDSRELEVPKDPPLFIQLNELLGWPHAPEWKETGRWVLFEEKLEVGAGRWSAPHVPTVALPSLQKLRNLLAKGLVLLDCPALSLQELAEQVTRVESLSPELRGKLKALLLQRPQHLIQTPCTSSCWGKRPLPGPKTKIPGDVRRKASWYLSDFLDALHPQCVSAVLYIYLATVTNAITFGGLLGEATDGAQGVLESFLGTAVTGAAFCLMAGQPLTILSSTGPVLVFERLLFSFSRDHSLDYLPFRLWVGIWVAIFCLVLVATEASVLDLGLINASLLPPPECAQRGGHPRGPGCHTVPDIAFFSILLFLTSFLFAMALKHVKTSRFFPSVVRKMLGDFSSVLAILLGCGLDAFLGLATPKLMVPREFKPTLPGRGWLVSPFGANPWWLSVAAALPALLLSILIFMDQQITGVILNRAEYRLQRAQIWASFILTAPHYLQKGAGFHLDLFCVAVLMLLTSALGLPWYVSATVISLAHMDSLRRESRACAPGEAPSFLGIREQRLSGLAVFILTGISIFLAPILKFIPMPLLYGIFLYMGVTAISSIQFTKRVQLLLIPAKHQPDLLFLRHVPLSRVHLFTAIQLACLGLLWIIKSTPAAIIFPIMELLWLDEPMPEKERSIPEKGMEPEYSFSGSDNEDKPVFVYLP
ncbi:SLC4A9 [Cervus elaphus hippelaphus]|uniref:SLC4A9 n=1 Tax=Cervus elaphus hippelaphus TaxID=46360 RepID=A0A212D213_CEREH|nr:SLC4A9 [Cervus elaphus hippelaphus]